MADLDGAQTRLERVRGLRRRPPRDLGLADEVRRQRDRVRRAMHRTTGVGEAWDEVVPEDLARRCNVKGISAGVLTVHVSDAPTRHLLDRFLRCGGQATLVSKSPVAIRRIRIRVQTGHR